MTQPALQGRLLPTEQQRLLLRCALGSAATVGEAWAAARRDMDFDRLDDGSHALLPLVYRALEAAAVDDPLLPRLKGIYRKAWFTNQLLMDAVRQPLGRLEYERAEPLLLHGTALLAGYYPETALRRIPCLDVAVRPGGEERALRGLERSGWVRHPDADGSFPVPLVDDGGRLLFLHAGLPEALLVPGAAGGGQDALWARARSVDVGGSAARVLEPTDQLLACCAVGPDLALVAGTQWLADAAIVVAGGAVDWAALAERARERRVVARVSAALRYLAAELDAGIPADALSSLSTVPRREALAYGLYARAGGPLGGLPQTLARHVRQTADLSAPRALAATPRFLGAHLRQRSASSAGS